MAAGYLLDKGVAIGFKAFPGIGAAAGIAYGYLNKSPVGEVAGNSVESVTRGISNHGGIFNSRTNEAGGEIWTSSGPISQNDFATYVNSGLYKGDVDIISGVHGTAEGKTIIDASLHDADIARFGDLPGVKIHNFPDLSAEQLNNLMRSPNTTIGGFCFSDVCLNPFK